MRDGRWVRTIVAGIVIGNLIVLAKFFMVPRMQFFPAHTGLTRQLTETPGPQDMPNQLGKTYAVANRIQELTPIEATVFVPPGDRLDGSFRSAVTQVLYPRKIIFGENENFKGELKKGFKNEAAYFVYSPEWQPDFCEEPSRVELTNFGFGMCRLAR